MKKIIAFIILLFYSCSGAFAFSELYYLKNANTNNIAQKVKNAYLTKDFTLIKEKPPFCLTNNVLPITL